ncbi:MAG: type IX secretion system sortase PorU [Ignavibacteria bacterium]|nr:type IX secretion system sortase PorU [Ignavibacteria bacterium]
MKTKFSIMFLFFVLNLALQAQDLKVLSSDAGSITLEYRLIVKDTINISHNGLSFIRLEIPGLRDEKGWKAGLPQLLVKQLNIGVQTETGNTIQVISSSFTSLSGRYIPNPTIIKDSSGNQFVYKVIPDYYKATETDLVTFGDFGLVRNLPVQTIKVYPVQFDAASNQIKIYNKIVFRVNIAASSSNKTIVNDETLSSLIDNWQIAKNWGEQQQSRLQKVSNSLLADGTWFRFETNEEGIHKIDRTFLQNLGVDVNTIDPKTIKIYGYGGAPLTEDLSKTNNKGLIENAIKIIGEEDGKFDAADYILFYARPTDFWEYNKEYETVKRTKNYYAKKNYYWLTFGGTAGKRMADKASLNASNAYPQTFTRAFKSYEKDSLNIGESGREYFGEQLDANLKSRTFINSLNSWVLNTPIDYTVRVAHTSTSSTKYKIEESGSQIYSGSIWGIDSHYDYGADDIAQAVYRGGVTDERSVLKISLLEPTATTKLYLDYIEIGYNKYLRATGDNLTVFSKDTTAVLDYTLTNFSSSAIQIFDVTDFSNVKLISNSVISGGQARFQASESKGGVSKYVAVTSNAYKTPTNAAKVENSNIRGTLSGSELIVIAPKDLKTQAERYLKYRTTDSPSKMTAQVFYVDEIFNEFSGGLFDPMAIRDFIKFAYDSWQLKPSYVLMFGDGTYDYLNTVKNNINFVPTYQTQESLNEISSYTSDDYFVRVSGADYKPDLAIGRICVQSAKEADIAIDKIISYETVQSKGDWRTSITLIADDGPAGTGEDNMSMHTAQSETIANSILPKFFFQNKIYLVAYPTVYVGVGRRKPEVNKAIINAINNGTLILNYVGHGSPELWAHENVFEKTTSIPQLKNANYFFLTAATCDFGRYDDSKVQSSTEILMNMKDAGTILAFTASRIVYSDYNSQLNDSLYTNLFRNKDVTGLPLRVGKGYFLTKQYIVNRENDEKYHLFGDPTIRINLPVLPVNIDSVNGKGTTSQIQVSALSNVKIKGSVRNSEGKINPINGEVVLTVYDSERSVYYQEMEYTVKQQGGLIYKGRATVSNGLFETEFVVPKDISYENKNGKVVAYVSNSATDGIGYSSNIVVGGTNQSLTNDNKGPEIEIFFDDTNFESSYLVNPSFTLIAKLKDQTGLNTTGTGIGHKLEAVINDDATNTYDLTNNFVGDLNSGGKSGLAKYNFNSMSQGDYKIKVKAWDVFNNFSFQEAAFTVVSADKGIVIRDVVNYPNPMTSNTTFTFQHNYSSAFNTKIKIYTIAGRLIKTIEENDLLEKFVKIDWDGRDEDGNQIANGTYLYKLILESADGSFKENILGKLAVVK